MKTQSITRQDLWLLDTILRAGRISFEEINQRWLDSEKSDGVEISRRTFIRHRYAIEDAFDILIECDKKDGYRYYIENPEDLQSAIIQRWMVNALSTSSLLAESKDLKNQIQLEDIPSGQIYLEKILQAMRKRQMLNMTYERFGKEPYTIDVEPYCVKLHHQRWYVIVRNSKSKHPNLVTYALDRIKQLEVIEGSHYELQEDFAASDFFKNYFGAYVNAEIQPERIVIRAFGTQADYIRTLPLHSSQKELSSCVDETGSYSDFEYYLSVTPDFINELLSKNDEIEVLEPMSLRMKMREKIDKMIRRYQEK
mgnify:CR=1 FL=1